MNLPDSMEVTVDVKDGDDLDDILADALSDETDWCVDSFHSEEIGAGSKNASCSLDKKNVKVAKALLALAKELVAEEGDGGYWKLVRVNENGRRETMQGQLRDIDDATDEERMDEMRRRIERAIGGIPDDCVLQPEDGQYVLRSKDGAVEWRMYRVSGNGIADGGRSKWKLMQVLDDGSEKFVQRVNFPDHGTFRDKQTKLIVLFNHWGVFVQRNHIALESQDEISVSKDGKVIYRVRKDK